MILGKMKKCERSIVLIFGYLLIMSILFIPYSEFRRKGPPSNSYFEKKSGYMFLPLFIAAKIQSPWRITRTVEINTELLTTELFLILFFAGFAYILFCVVLRKDNNPK